jgi:DNA-binding response OmpR family regulator
MPGEDLATVSLLEVASWIAIYEELTTVLRRVLERQNGDLSSSGDLKQNLAWVESRLPMWRDRHSALAGVIIDRKDHSLTYGGRKLRLTRREADLLDFMLRHPNRPFTTKQLATLAWQNSRLSDAQVRTYMMRLRNRLREVALGHMITVVRNRGYGVDVAAARAGAG